MLNLKLSVIYQTVKSNYTTCLTTNPFAQSSLFIPAATFHFFQGSKEASQRTPMTTILSKYCPKLH